MLSWITWTCCRSPAAFVVVSDPLDALSITCPSLKHPSLLLIPLGRLLPPTPPLALSIPWARKRAAASAVGDVLSGVSSLLLPPPTTLLSLLRPWAHIPLLTPPSLSSIPQARHRNATASVVVTKSSPPLSLYPIPQTRLLFVVLRRCIRYCL